MQVLLSLRVLPLFHLDSLLLFMFQHFLPDLGLPHDLQHVVPPFRLDLLGILERLLHSDALGPGLLLCCCELGVPDSFELESPLHGDTFTFGEAPPRLRDDSLGRFLGECDLLIPNELRLGELIVIRLEAKLQGTCCLCIPAHRNVLHTRARSYIL